MPDLTLVAPNAVRIVGIPEKQYTIPGEESITAGQAVRISPTTAKLTKSNATSATEARVKGIATRTPENFAVGITIIRQGVLDGFDLSALPYDAPVYLSNTDGSLSDTAGTTSILVGRVMPGGAALGVTADKLLEIDIAL